MENKTKYYTSKEISKIYATLSLEEKNKVLYEAIDYMKVYNGRSRFLCIAMAMGYDNDEGDGETWSQMLPNEPIDVEYCSCEYPTLGSNISKCGTCQKWFKRVS